MSITIISFIYDIKSISFDLLEKIVLTRLCM